MGHALVRLATLTLLHALYECRGTTDRAECRRLLAEWHPDLAIIDVDNYDPFVEIVQRDTAASSTLGIIALSRRRSALVKLRALERGVDDIVEVPFMLDELVARPYALLRRIRGSGGALTPKIAINGLSVDLLEQTVTLEGGRRLDLTPTQQALLYILAANAGETLSRETLLANIWGSDMEIESNVVDRHIRELRVKLDDDWRSPRYIETVSGQGYRFRGTAAAIVPQPYDSAAIR
jgi:DNA-binding response OmpR family regulator